MSRSLHLLASVSVLVGGILAPGCASPGETPEPSVLVTLRDYRRGARFELASESHTDRVAYYSDPRAEAGRKIQTDEVMSALVRELDRLGFGANARVGPAPEAGASDVLRWGLEAEGSTGTAHWLIGTGSRAEDWKAFEQCRELFLELYNATVSYQAVENDSGREFFEEKARAASGKTAPR